MRITTLTIDELIDSSCIGFLTLKGLEVDVSFIRASSFLKAATGVGGRLP